MATIEQLSQALVNADKAGDADAARALAAEITKMKSEPSDHSNFERLITGEPMKPKYDIPYGAGAAWTDAATGGMAGKASAGLNALLRAPFTDKTIGEEYDELYGSLKQAREKYAEESPKANLAANIGGGVIGGGQLMSGAGNLLSRIPGVNTVFNSGIVGRTAADLAGGAAFGGVSAAGYDEDIAKGAAIGGAMGAVARPVLALGGAGLNTAAGLMGLGNRGRAANAMAEAVARSGRSVDDITDDLTRAVAEGQPQYTVADALGNSGQRMLSGIVRTPGDGRQAVVEALQARQAGQGRRIQNALTEGFGSPQTAQQTEAAQRAMRTADARTNYGAARAGARSVNPTKAIEAADEFLGTAGSLPRTGIADDSVEGVVRRARSLLTDGDNVVSDFDTAFRAKVELDNMIESGSGTIQAKLKPIRDALDASLEDASDTYRNARDTYRQQSQALEAVQTGRDAARRGRVEDTIPTFTNMRPDQQQGFRAGYADDYIADVQKAVGPMTNKARPLISDATAQEFPAFAIQGQGDTLMNRIGREQRMFETANTALGGSKTADNLADTADASGFDPMIIGNILTGNWPAAAKTALAQSAAGISGRNQATRDMIARALMESSPTRANAELAGAVARGQRLTNAQQMVIKALIGGSVGATAGGTAN
jgi:hypothetical protein